MQFRKTITAVQDRDSAPKITSSFESIAALRARDFSPPNPARQEHRGAWRPRRHDRFRFETIAAVRVRDWHESFSPRASRRSEPATIKSSQEHRGAPSSRPRATLPGDKPS